MTSDQHSWIVRLVDRALPDRNLIGGKAWSIARISSLGLPVPPAFVVTTEAHAAYAETGAFPEGLVEELASGIASLEQETGRRFGEGPRPLLVSVRSGAAISMPGMMDTVLNLGMNEQTEALLAAECQDPLFARDTHRRFLQLYGDIVCKAGVGHLPKDGDPESWRADIASKSGISIPRDVYDQLHGAVAAVFESWNSRRARRYRDHHGISHGLGTAVTVQAMVFGNMDERSGTGVVFSRNPGTGAREIFGEYLAMAQGEDVVSGAFSPEPLSDLRKRLPEAYDALVAATSTLEAVDQTVQDVEFTVERGRLYLLQCRAAKLAPIAAVRSAVDMAREGVIDARAALARVSPDQVRQLLQPRLTDEAASRGVNLARGEGACPGVGSGVVVGDADEAERRAAAGECVVLARPTTSPHDVHGMIAATATITEQGGSTSHAAVVSRALGRPCVVGCGAGALQSLLGKTVTVSGSLGVIYEGELPVETPDERTDPALMQLREWALAYTPLDVFTPREAPSKPIFDLDKIDGGEDPDRLVTLLSELSADNFPGLRGGAIQHSAAIQAAIAAGFSFVVAEPALPCLIAAVQAAAKLADAEDSKTGSIHHV